MGSPTARTDLYAQRMPPAATPEPRFPAPSSLVLTGERTLPGIADERYWFQRHVVAYLVAAEHLATTSGAVVLDAGCGEGYGLDLLARGGADRVIGVDLDLQVVEHATATYARGDIEVVRAELSTLPFPDDEVDLVVSFQVIEHLHDVPSYLASLFRVTRPGGAVWIATPNRLTFTPESDVPTNPFHVREFAADELHDELTSAGLVVDRLLGVHHGARLRAEEERLGRRLVDAIVEVEPEAWGPELRAAVHATSPDDFEVTDHDLDASLDLLALTRVPERT